MVIIYLSLIFIGEGVWLNYTYLRPLSRCYRNPQLEEQASDRCHRVGQQRDVTIHRLEREREREERFIVQHHLWLVLLLIDFVRVKLLKL